MDGLSEIIGKVDSDPPYSIKESASEAYNEFPKPEIRFKVADSTSAGTLEKSKAPQKIKLWPNTKEKHFSLDNILPTLEANMKKEATQEAEDNSSEGLQFDFNFTSVSTSVGKCSETAVSYEADASSNCSNSQVTEAVMSKQEVSVDSEIQEQVDGSHGPTQSKRPKTESSVSYKDKHVSSVELEECNVGSEDKPYVCPVCQRCFKQAFPLKRHMMIHSAVKPFFCTVCDFRCNDGSNLRKHMQTHAVKKKLKCPDCDYTCSRPDHLRNHRAKHTGNYRFQCGICGYGCNQACDLTRHMIVHGGGKFFSCDYCDFSTNRRSTLRVHVEKHLNAEQFVCSICSYQPSSAVGLRNHMLVHTKEKTYACAECGFLTTSKSSLIRHGLVHRKCEEDGTPVQKRYQCLRCEFSCHWRSDLAKHLRRKHDFVDRDDIDMEIESADTHRAAQAPEQEPHEEMEPS
ncbi:zinc finger protein 64 [Elysia marginata]|uniref:Zinc finger protein 64 n=1 Tax=Elysia marginata TaxID=1093978 RepID=A0AAV4IPU1_9GAST|nr:zinc finger protein 64 [Elysia marginata]